MDSRETKPSPPSDQQLEAPTLGIKQNQNPQQQQPENRKRDSDCGGERNANSADPPAKRGRGRPPRSGDKQLGGLGRTKGLDLLAHIIEVEIGEDIVSKIKEFSDQWPRSVNIICANGSISSVTLSGNAAAAYEGRFPITTLSGSFVSSSGSLTVGFSGPYAQFISGVVIGSLVAATKVQVLVESILLETKNSGGYNQEEPAHRLSTGSGS